MPSKVQTRGGQRLAAALASVDKMPALAQAREDVLRAGLGNGSAPDALIQAVERDPGLAIAVVRRAKTKSPGGVPITSIAEAVSRIGAPAVHEIAAEIDTFDFLERGNGTAAALERFRVHALTTQTMAAIVSQKVAAPDHEQLMLTALLHDAGRLVTARLRPDGLDGVGGSPEERVAEERRELGIDHALVGGVLARRWGLPKSISGAIERHHAEDADGAAAIVRLADMLAHHAQGEPVAAQKLRAAAHSCGLRHSDLQELVYSQPGSEGRRNRMIEPSPLSVREMEVLRSLADGKVYKQIAAELTLSVSTVRTHLHNVYAKLGVIDRAQAVLTATDKGWI